MPVFCKYYLYAHKLHETNNTVKYHARFVVGWLARKGCAGSDADCFEIDRVHGLGNDRDRGLHHGHLGDNLDDHNGNHLGIGFDFHLGIASGSSEIDSGISFDFEDSFVDRIAFASEPSSVASVQFDLEDWRNQTRC